ncbi:hypothetical protein [Intestinibacter sp.]|uniref:hypothetical protein n=1 Tax=Intestinibacter sp. TaxID=1965304 RepID=UPI003F17AAD1
MKREFNKEAQSVLNKVLTDIHWQKIKQNKLIEEANELPSTISNLIGEYVQIGDKNYMLVGKAKQVFSDVVFLYGPGLSLYSYHGLDETGCLMEFRSIMVNPQCLDDVKIITREEFNTAVLSYVDKFLVDITENNWVKEHNKI